MNDYEFSFNGVTFGGETGILFYGSDDLFGFPTRGEDVARTRRDGNFRGLKFYAEKIFTLNLAIRSGENIAQNLATVSKIFALTQNEKPLDFKLPHWAESRRLSVRVTNFSAPLDLDYAFNAINFSVEFTASYPIIQGSELNVFTRSISPEVTNFTFPAVTPFGFGQSTSAKLQINNTGNYKTFPRFQIFNVNGAELVKDSTGETISLSLSTAGRTIEVDTFNHLVTLEGQVVPTGVTPSTTWFFIEGNETVSIVGEILSGAEISALWRNSWVGA